MKVSLCGKIGVTVEGRELPHLFMKRHQHLLDEQKERR
jgi:hypothetical protein